MNRPNFPPQYFQGPPPHQAGGPSGGRPPSIRQALLTQSQARFAFFREALMKLDAGFSQLDIEARSVQQNLTYRDPVGASKLEMSLSSVRTRAQKTRRDIEQACEDEIALQGEIQRWLAGQPPSDYNPSQQPLALSGGGSTPWPGQVVPGQSSAAQPGDQGTRVAAPPAMMPEIPPGQLDLRDPRQAAAALLRAAPLPLNPMTQSQQPQYPPQYVPPQYAQASAPQVPVQMAYADPSQAGPPNMPSAPPVQQFATAAEAQAAQASILAQNPVHASQLNAQAASAAASPAPAAPVNGTAKAAPAQPA
jgi:hypothetical protein